MVRGPFEAFKSFAAYSKQIEELLFLSIYAVSHLHGASRLAEVVSEVKSDLDGEEHRTPPEELARIRKMEDLAQEQRAKGHPMLVAHSVVALWSALEATIPAFCADWIVSQPSCLSSDDLSRVRVPASLLGATDRRAAASAVVDEISRQIDSSLKPGIGRFQGVLEKLGITFPIDDKIRGSLFELSKVRNLVVHRFGRVDLRFVGECPRFKLSVGEELRLTVNDYIEYRRVAGEYASNILRAAHERMKLSRLDDAPPQL